VRIGLDVNYSDTKLQSTPSVLVSTYPSMTELAHLNVILDYYSESRQRRIRDLPGKDHNVGLGQSPTGSRIEPLVGAIGGSPLKKFVIFIQKTDKS